MCKPAVYKRRMRRRDFLAQFGTANSLTPWALTAAPQKPNILFILADDLGYGDLGCYGQKQIQTPHLDQFAADGIRFTQGYAGSTVCAPSRCCLMTGKHTGHATVRGNVKPELGLQPGEAVLPRLLRAAGYQTALFGKWGLGGPGTGNVPNQAGFDEFFGFLDQQHAHNSFPEHLWDNQNEYFLTQNWFGGRNVFVQDLFTRKAVDFIRRPHSQPFFVYLAYTSPHADNERGAAFPNGIDVPSMEPYQNRDWPDVEKSFAALVSRLDRDVGTMLQALSSAGLARNTLVIFASDNGPHAEGNHKADFFQSRGPLRGIKRDLYEGGIRVPMMARWPGRIRSGQVSDQVVAFWDMLPSLCEAAGIDPPGGLDGAPLLPALLGEKTIEHRPLYWEFHERHFLQAVRWGDWKAVREGKAGKPELYNLKSDLGEQHDIATQNTEAVQTAARLMDQLRTDSPRFPVT
jgi:arylsulfatase A-like enzyme